MLWVALRLSAVLRFSAALTVPRLSEALLAMPVGLGLQARLLANNAPLAVCSFVR